MNDAPPSGSGTTGGRSASALERRTSRSPDSERRCRVLAQVAGYLTAPPEQQLREVVTAVRELCGAGSVGFSRPRGTGEPAETFRWHEDACAPNALAGDIAVTSGPAVGALVLLDDPPRDFPELASADPGIVEALLAPLHADGRRIGTLWALSHDPERRFDVEDGHALESLRPFAAAAYRAYEHERELSELRRGREEDYALFEHASVAMRWVAADGTIRWANQTELDLLGYERDEYIGRSIADFHADPDALREAMDSLQSGRMVQDHPARMIRKDGAVLEVEVSSNALWRDGEFVHTRCFTRDVTERRRGEHARARLAAIVESSDDAILSKDLRGTIASWNRAAERLFGYSAEQAIGQSVTMLMPPDRVDEEPGILRRIRAGERVEPYETVRQHRDGRPLDISLTVSPVFDGGGRIVGASTIARDITARKRTEHLLRSTKAESERQRRLYETVMASTPDLVFVVDRDLCLTLANDAMLQTWGCSREVSLGRRLRELRYEPWQAQRHEQEFEHILATGEIVRGEVPYPHAEHGERMYDYIFAPVIDENGQVEAIAGTVRDMTEFKQAEQGLRDSQERLTELNRSLEQRVVERTGQLQRQTERLRELAAELTTAEQRERKRLAAMLHDDLQQLVVAAQIQLGRTRGRIADAEAAEAITGAERLLDESMSASRNLTRQLRPPVLYEDGLVSALRGLATDIEERYLLAVRIDDDTAGDLPPLSDDQGAMLFESVRELLLNASRHSGADEAVVEARREGAALRLAVTDRGRGFDTGTLASGQRSDGFGLFSIRERLNALGGEFRVESAPGQGTRIELTAPLASAEGETAVPARPSQGGQPREILSGRRVRLLIADDHALVRQGIAHVLGHHERLTVVAEAGDGIEALELIGQEQPDVVLMDVNMPRMNGVEATREVRRRWPEVITIGLSVQDDDSTAELMREAGAVGFLPKSGDAGRMIARLLALVDTPPTSLAGSQ